MRTIGVVGLGIVGGTVAGAFAEAGFTVRGYDLYQGVGAPDDLLDCDVVFLCVPTPSGSDGGHDLSEVWAATERLAGILRDGTVVVLKSTVPPGTHQRLQAAFPALRFAVVPEFLVATRTAETFTHPDRVVVGTAEEEVGRMLGDLMSIVAPGAPIVVVRPLEAELVKLCSNAMLAAKVSMANELALVCAAFGTTWPRIQAVVGMDRRIGPDHMTVSKERGFGGVCLPKDLDGLIVESRAAGHPANLLEAIAAFNRAVRRDARVDGPPVGTTAERRGVEEMQRLRRT